MLPDYAAECPISAQQVQKTFSYFTSSYSINCPPLIYHLQLEFTTAKNEAAPPLLNDVIEPIKGADWVKESLGKYALGRATDPKRINTKKQRFHRSLFVLYC